MFLLQRVEALLEFMLKRKKYIVNVYTEKINIGNVHAKKS